MRSFSSTFPSRIIRLMGRYFEVSKQRAFPCLVIGIIYAIFHTFRQQPVLKQPFYIAVMSRGNFLNACLSIRIVMSSSPGKAPGPFPLRFVGFLPGGKFSIIICFDWCLSYSSDFFVIFCFLVLLILRNELHHH